MGWERGLPTDAIIGLTYFEDLRNPTKPSLQRRKGELVRAVNAVMGSAGSLKPGSETINSALEFLLSIAQSEQTKELAILEDYKKRLKDTLPENKELDSLIDSLTLENASKDKDFYIKLTKAINMIRQGTENFKNRLDRFQQHNGKEISELYKDEAAFRLPSDLQSMINSVIGVSTGQENSYSEKLRTISMEKVLNSNIMKQIGNGADFIYVLSAVQSDLAVMIQKEARKDPKFSDFTNLSDELINKITENYGKEEEKNSTDIEKMLMGNIDELQHVIDEGKKFIPIKELKDTDVIQKRAIQINKNKEKDKNLLRNILEDSDIDKQIILDLNKIEVSMKVTEEGSAKNIHGFVYEYLSAITRSNSTKVRGSSAIDLITVEYAIKLPEVKDRIRVLQKIISDAYTKYASLQRSLNQDNNRQLLNELNAVIRQAEEALNKQLSNLNKDIGDIFVYHETLKLYGSMETGKQYSSSGFELGKFHGRNIALLTAITELYSAAGIGAGALPNRTALEMIAYNLAPGALGAGYKGDVEYIFSIFAGLLMFGDIQNMALEAAKAIDTGSIKNIHMYLLNDVYVPASMLLMNTYEAASQAVSMLSSDQAATAKIALRGSRGVVDNWLATRPSPTPEMWESIGDKVGSEIQIQISFMSGFVNFVNSLMKI